jgi:hypothetical protein
MLDSAQSTFAVLSSIPSEYSILHQSSRLRAYPCTRIHINAIRARSPNLSTRHPLAHEPILLKCPYIPRSQSRASEQHPSTHLHRSVHRLCLRSSLRTTGRKPVHAVHQYCDGQSFGLHAGEDLGQFVGVDAEVVKGIGGGEASVRFLGQVGGVAFGCVFAYRLCQCVQSCR